VSDAALAAYAARLRELKTLPKDVAKEAAPMLETAVKETAAAGTTPDGKAWPSKKDGTRALPDASGAISATVVGARVVVKLVGAYVYHHFFRDEAKRRQILPDGGAGVPPKVVELVKRAGRRVFQRTMQ
jgi:hypothetical protein